MGGSCSDEGEGHDAPQAEESSAEHALDAVAQLTALVQAKSQEAERLRTHLETIEQFSECCICFDRPVSHAFMYAKTLRARAHKSRAVERGLL